MYQGLSVSQSSYFLSIYHHDTTTDKMDCNIQDNTFECNL